MKKKILLSLVLAFMLTACGSDSSSAPAESKAEVAMQESTETTPKETESPDLDSPVSSLDAVGDIEVDKGIFDVEINIPAEYMGETTQEELDETAKAAGYKAVLNDDGSATFTMSKTQHKKMMAEISESLKASLEEMIESEDYPNFTDIRANEDFTNFTITTKSTELNLSESFSTIAFYMYGGIYNIYNGTAIDNIHVDFVNADSGEIISSSDSKDMN